MQQNIAFYSNGKRTGKQAKKENTAYHHSDKPRVRPKIRRVFKRYGLTRKEFVELSVDYFQRTGFDLRGEAFDLSPLEKVAGRLEQSAKIMERHNEGTESVRLLLQAVREQTAKQLPAPELIAHAAEEKAKAEAKNEEQEREIARLRSENSALQEYKEKAHRELCRVRDEQKTIGKIKVHTEL